MIAAIYACNSQEQPGVADDAESVRAKSTATATSARRNALASRPSRARTA
jgi:hypothetical protein